MKFVKEERGQAGDVFRLMIDAIIGLVILVMILSTITYFQSLRVQISIAEVRNLVLSAVETPSGKILESNELAFTQGEGYYGSTFEEWTGLPSDCFEFQSSLGSVKVYEGAGGGLEFNRPITAKAYAACEVTGDVCDYGEGGCEGICEMICIFSIGSKPDFG